MMDSANNVYDDISNNVKMVVPMDCNKYGFASVEKVMVHRIDGANVLEIQTSMCMGFIDAVMDLFEIYENAGQTYKVGVNGISTDDEYGSTRFCNHSRSLASFFETTLRDTELFGYNFCKVSPYFRFMNYECGGEHFPHYDSDYESSDGYLTTHSMVVYLTNNETGEFAFVNDTRENVPNNPHQGNSLQYDWDRQANEEEIILKVKPRVGKILVFPHKLCHTVLKHTDKGGRVIIRGDLQQAIV